MTRYTYSVASSTAARPLAQRAIVALLLVTGIVLLALARTGNPALSGARARLLGVVEPALSAVARPVSAVRDMARGTHDFFAANEENRTLRAENDALRHWQSAALELKAQNDSLRQLAGYAPVEHVSYVTARVVSANASGVGHSLVIDAGAADGISLLQPVVDAYGLVGRIIELAPHSARVLLLSDVNSHVPVVTGDSRQHAILTGTGSDMLQLSFLPADAPVALGEKVATTEEASLIPGGVAVGSVFRKDESGIFVKPVRPLAQPEFVRVIEFSSGVSAH